MLLATKDDWFLAVPDGINTMVIFILRLVRDDNLGVTEFPRLPFVRRELFESVSAAWVDNDVLEVFQVVNAVQDTSRPFLARSQMG